MQRVTVDVQFVTPCFLGGADPTQSAEWRAESIRGQLRWWFRAVAARDLGFDVGRVRQAEEAVWGSTTRKSAVDIIVEPLAPDAVETAHVKFMDTVEGSGKGSINGPVYLGYGLFETAGPTGGKFFQTARPFIRPAETARFHLVRRGEMTPHEVSALRAWLGLGGIGSRSRRGYGSLALAGVVGTDVSLRCDEQHVLGGLKRDAITAQTVSLLPELPAVSDFTRIYRWKTASETQQGVAGWRKALHAAGKSLIRFRRRFKQGTPPTLDYEWAYAGGGSEAGLPHRVGFGLPLPFGKPVILQGVEHDRRASPLLIHIAIERSDGRVKYRPIMTFLPSKFLPDAEQVAFFRKQGDRYVSTKGVFPVGLDHYQIVQTFLDTLTSGPNAVATEVV